MSIKVCSWFAACLILTLTTACLARQAVVHLDDGRTIQGEMVVDNNKEIVLDIAGIRTAFTRAKVTKVTYVKSTEEQYKERRAKVADDDLEGRYGLVRWLFEKHSYVLAKSELTPLIEQFPRDGRLEALDKLIDARMKLLQEAPASTKKSDQKGASASDTQSTPSAQTPARDGQTLNFNHKEVVPRLTDEQINIIRVYEVNPNTHPHVNVPNDVMQDVYKKYAGQEDVPVGVQAQRDALGAEGWRKLQLLFQLRARDLYPRVTVYNDPKTLADFRSKIHTRYVLSYCASNACHGGKDAGDFFLFRFQPGSVKTVYTNYYILNKYSNTTSYMIDRQKPNLSLLVQYALPRASATTPHPDVKGWTSLFQSLNQDLPAEVINWIQSLGTTEPRYPINYNIPHLDKKGQVAKQAAATSPTEPPTKRGEVPSKSAR